MCQHFKFVSKNFYSILRVTFKSGAIFVPHFGRKAAEV